MCRGTCQVGSNATSVSNQKAHLVMVEDSPTQAARLKFQLEGQGYRVRVANRGEQAIELCKEESPDLLITDVTMPGMDGYELCRLIKADEVMRGIPVMLLTGLSDPQDIIWGLEAGADCYLTKPYTDEELFNRIEFVLDNVSSEELMNAEETEPIKVTFLGQSHTITSTRKQMLNLLLSTYESAARRNEHLDKAQLKMKIDLKETQRRAEMAEASLTVAQAQLEEGEEAWVEVVKQIPLPLFVYDDGSLVQYSEPAAADSGKYDALEKLKATGLKYESTEVEISGVDLTLVTLSPETGGEPQASAAPAPTAHSGEQLPPQLKRAFLERISAAIHQPLAEAERAQDDLEKIKVSLRKLQTLDLLQWESLEYHLDQGEIDLKESVDQAVDSYVLQALAAGRGQTIKSGELPEAKVLGDKDRLSQAVGEVLENALKYGPENSEVEVGLRKVNDTWEIFVSDKGSGPAAEVSGNLGQPFTAGGGGGLGLGLAYAKKVCLSHKGELVLSTDNGCTVGLRVPA